MNLYILVNIRPTAIARLLRFADTGNSVHSTDNRPSCWRLLHFQVSSRLFHFRTKIILSLIITILIWHQCNQVAPDYYSFELKWHHYELQSHGISDYLRWMKDMNNSRLWYLFILKQKTGKGEKTMKPTRLKLTLIFPSLILLTSNSKFVKLVERLKVC